MLIALIFTGITANAQNINIPNRTGPMGLEVNSYTGNLFYDRMDIAIPGVELNMMVGFSYNSYNFDINRGFGNGWSFEYDVHYITDTANNIIVTWGDGSRVTYRPLGNGNYQSPTGYFSVLKEYAAGKFSITQTNGLQYLFEDATIKMLTKIQTPNGNFTSINHNGTQITSLVNSMSQTINFTYDAQGLLQTVTDAITAPTRSWNYAYDNVGNLVEVTDPLGGQYQYTYLINGPMQTITDKNMNVVDLVYFNNFSLREMVGCNQHMSFSYDTTQKVTVITDHMANGQNQVNKYFYERIGDLIWVSAISSNCCGFDVVIEYDEEGNKIKETDANGNITQYTYDDNGNVTATTDALGQTTTYTYTSDFNNISSITNPKGFVTQIEYDANGNLIKITEPDGGLYTAAYNAQGQIISSTNPRGKTYTYTYDALGNLQTVNRPDGSTANLNISPRGYLLEYTNPNNHAGSIDYDILGRMTQITDPLNHQMNFSFDAMSNVTQVQNENNEITQLNYDASNRLRSFSAPLGNNAVFGYDGMGNIISLTDAEGATTTFEYDSKNLLSIITDAEGNTTTLSYDPKGNLITANLPSGRTLTYTYDALDRVTEVNDNDGMIGKMEYDANGNISKITDGEGVATDLTYNNEDRIIEATDALGNSIALTYDAVGNIQTIQDKMGNTSTLVFDDLGRVISFTDNLGAITQIGYDAAGNVVSLTDANNNTTTYTYDALDRVTKTTFPDGKYTALVYDVESNIASFRTKDGNTINYTYDSLNRVKTKSLPNGQVFSYGYDKTGKVISASNDAGTVYFTYDFLNRLTSETFNGRTVNYAYNINGRTQTTTYPEGTEILKTFDTRGMLSSIQKNGSLVVSYLYNNAGQLTKKTFTNGVVTDLQYDFAGRLTHISTGSLRDLGYDYDNNGNITSIIRGSSNLSEFFTYDANNRLLTYKQGQDGGPFTSNDNYNYDVLGNRVSASIGGKNISYTTNNLNQIVSMNDGTATTNFVYGNNGNLLFDGEYYKFYDLEKRLLKDSVSPAEVITYQYDAFGRKIAKTINGISSYFTYAGLQPIVERDNNNIIQNRIVFSGYLQPVMNENNGTPYYYHQNHLNSVALITNNSGNVTEQYRYDAYGKQSIFDEAGNPLTGSITGNRFGFTGQVYDSATGNLQFFFRSYNPETGIFDQQDLIGYGDGMGMYQYVGNNPGNGVDVLGLKDCEEVSKVVTVSEYAEAMTTWQGTAVTIMDEGSKWRLNRYLKSLEKSNKTYREIEQALLSKNKQLIRTIGKGSSSYLKGANAARLGRIANADNAVHAISTGGKTAKFLGKAGKGLGVVGIAANGVQLGYEISNSTSPLYANPDVGLATADLMSSGLSMVPGFGTVYGLLDLAVSTTTGGSINQHVSDGSKAYFETTINAKVSEEILQKESELIKHYKEIGKYDTYLKVLKNRRERTNRSRNSDCPQNNNPNGTQRPPHGPGGGGGGTSGQTEILNSRDPNEIIGPDGRPDKHWVSVKDRLPYTVTFENSELATAPAKYVKVIVPVAEKMAVGTFQLSGFGFNNQSFTIPAGTASSYQRLDARDSLGLFIDLVAGFDPMRNEFFWEFQAISPVTLIPPTQPLVGFLLMQDTSEVKTQNGHGFVNFSVKPDADAQTLDSILAFAKIVFDFNDTIPTNIEKNVIDAVAPTSQMDQLQSEYTASIPLSWSGQDDPNGCGVEFYTLYISTDGVNFSILKENMIRTDTLFTGPPQTQYYFFVLATDSVGNVELLGPGAVKTAYLGSALPVNWLYFKGANKGNDNLLEWATASESNAKEYRVERSFDATEFTDIGSVKASGNTSGNSSYQYTDYDVDELGQRDMYYRLAQVDQDGRVQYSNVVHLVYEGERVSKTIVYPNPTEGIFSVKVGDPSLIGTKATVVDEAGKVLMKVEITSNNQSFNLGNYTNGIYFIRFENKEVFRIVKQ